MYLICKIRSSSPQKPNQIARLLTPLDLSDKQCLTFYYHMWGEGIGVLNIKTKSSSGSLSIPYWTRNQNYGDNWNLGQVTLPSVSALYQIAFEGIIGGTTLNSFEGDIAIDDVRIERRECLPIGFCDFETLPRFCTWTNNEGLLLLVQFFIKK